MEETNQEVKKPSEGEILESLSNLANPKCKKCHGTGRLGWNVTNGNREVIPCTARNCAVHKFYYIRLLQRREEIAKQQETEKEKGVSSVENT